MEDEGNPQNMDEPELGGTSVDEEELRIQFAEQDFDDENSPGQDSLELPEDNEDEAEDDDGRASPVSHSRPRNEDPSQTRPSESPGRSKTSSQHPDQQRPRISQHSRPSRNRQPPQPDGILTRTAHLPPDYGKRTSRAGRGAQKPPSFLAEVMPDKTTLCFFFVNFLFLAVGCIVIALVVAILFVETEHSILFRFDSVSDMSEENHMGFLHSAGVAAITTGTAIVLLCFLGCVGVVQRNNKILNIYIYSIVALIVLQVVAVATAFYYGNTMKKTIEGTLLNELAKVYDGQLNSTNSFSKAFDYAHVFFGCCGVTSYTDFEKTPWYKKANKIRNVTANDKKATPLEVKFPPTCCRLKDQQQFLADMAAGGDVSADFYDPNCLTRVPSRDNEYTEVSCLEALIQFFADKASTMLYMAVVVVILQASGVISAMAIEHDIDKCELRLRLGQNGVHK